MNRNPQIAFERGYRAHADGTVTNPKGKTLKCYLHHKGYRKFHFMRGAALQVSRLVAFQKFGQQIFEPGIEVRHLDGNSQNDREENILIGTHSENMMDVPPEMRRLKSSMANRRHDPQAIRQFHQQARSYRLTMQKFGITSKGTLNHILNHATLIRRELHGEFAA